MFKKHGCWEGWSFLLSWCKELLKIMYRAYIFGMKYIWGKYLKTPPRLAMTKNLSHVLGQSFQISETCKLVAWLEGFGAHPGTMEILSIPGNNNDLFWAKFSWSRCFSCNWLVRESRRWLFTFIHSSICIIFPPFFLPSSLPSLLPLYYYRKSECSWFNRCNKFCSGSRIGMQQISSAIILLSLFHQLSLK